MLLHYMWPEIILFLPVNLDAFCFSCLIALARTSNTMLNRSGNSRHPSLVPVRKAFCLHCCMMLAVDFCIYGLYYVEVVSFLVCWVSLSWKGVKVCQMLFLHKLRWPCLFLLHSVNVVDYFDFHMLNHPCIPGINPSWWWCIIPSICCWKARHDGSCL